MTHSFSIVFEIKQAMSINQPPPVAVVALFKLFMFFVYPQDVPTELPEGILLLCNHPREDSRDAFISKRFQSLQELPQVVLGSCTSIQRL